MTPSDLLLELRIFIARAIAERTPMAAGYMTVTHRWNRVIQLTAMRRPEIKEQFDRRRLERCKGQ